MNFAETIDALNFSDPLPNPNMVQYSFGRGYRFYGSETLGFVHVEPTDIPLRRFKTLRKQSQNYAVSNSSDL